MIRFPQSPDDAPPAAPVATTCAYCGVGCGIKAQVTGMYQRNAVDSSIRLTAMPRLPFS